MLVNIVYNYSIIANYDSLIISVKILLKPFFIVLLGDYIIIIYIYVCFTI